MSASATDQTIIGGGPPPESKIRSKLDAAIFTTPGQAGKIHRFTVLRVLGEGGMGVVYAAYDEELDRRVAIKLVRDDLHEGSQGGSRMLREAQAMARVSHPNVVQVYEVGKFAGQVFLAMEYIKGLPLNDWVNAEERSWQEIRDMYIQAGLGIAAAHAQGLVHRDFKPDNVLVGNDGRARVLDFGLARAEDSAARSPNATDSMLMSMSALTTSNSAFEAKLTVVGTIMGTPAYMSPEQHMGMPTEAPSDQFSFCVALYEAIYAQHPFPGESYQELAEAVTCGEPRQPPRSNVPDWLLQALLTGMAVNPDDRHPSMDTLLAALSQDSAPVVTPRSRWLWPAVTLFVAACAVLVTLSLVADGDPSPEELAMIQNLEKEAREAADHKLWVYPDPDDLDDTAFRRVAALESLEGNADAAGDATAKELRIEFAEQLVALGDKYYGDKVTRATARDYYTQALVFQPDNTTALKRAGTSMGQIAELRERAKSTDFSDEELSIAEIPKALASATDEEIGARLVKIHRRPETRSLGSMMATRSMMEKFGAPADDGQLLATKQPKEPTEDPIEPKNELEAEVEDPDTENPDTASKGKGTGKGKGKSKGKDKAKNNPNQGGGEDQPIEPYDVSRSQELSKKAKAAHNQGALAKAEQLYNQALGAWNQNPAALIGLSDINFDRASFDRAVKFAKRAVAADPRNAGYRLRLGDAYFKVFRYNDARRSYEKAASLGSKRAKERLDRVREKTGE